MTALLTQFEADDERSCVQRGECRGGVGQVVDLDASDQQRAQRSVGGGRDDARGVPPSRIGEFVDVPRGGHLGAGGGVRQRPTAGQEVRCGTGFQRATLAGPTGDPAHAGTGALDESKHRGVRARGSRKPFADQDDRPGIHVLAQRIEGGGLPTGCRGDERAAHLLQPPRGERCDRTDHEAVLAERLAQAEVDDRGFLFWLEPDQQDGGAPIRRRRT